MLKKLTSRRLSRKVEVINERVATLCATCEWDCREFCSIEWSRASQTAIMDARIKV